MRFRLWIVMCAVALTLVPALPAGAVSTISGVVTRAGTPASGAQVVLYRLVGGQWQEERATDTDDEGAFAFDVPADAGPGEPFRIGFSAYGWQTEYYDGQSTVQAATDVFAGDEVSADLARVASIRGRVTDTTGRGLPDVTVTVYRLINGQWLDIDTSYTEGDGDYVFALPEDAGPSETFRIGYAKDGYTAEFYDDSRSISAATQVRANSVANAELETVTAPTAIGQYVVTKAGAPVRITLEGGPDPSALTFTIASPPSNGGLSGSDDTWEYTPDGGFTGRDRFTFTVSDGSATSAEAAVEIAVVENSEPVASAQSVRVVQGSSTTVTLGGDDADGDPLEFRVVRPPQRGALSGSGVTRTYTPGAGYSGPDDFAFVVSDGQSESAPATVSIDVAPVTAPTPTPVGPSAAPPAGGTAPPQSPSGPSTAPPAGEEPRSPAAAALRGVPRKVPAYARFSRSQWMKSKMVRLPSATTLGQPVRYTSVSRSMCRVVKAKGSWRIKGIRPGKCVLRARARATTEALPMSRTLTLRIVR
jgi:5-hydroxyisourate hydrolase-like protein (transthyretin family)